MIKAGIAGAGTRIAGELIRILVNHPDVEIAGAASRQYAGLSLTAAHHGLIGESPIIFSPTLDAKKMDVVFLCDPDDGPTLEALRDMNQNLKVIDLTWRLTPEPEKKGVVFALSEIYRKPLVRGAMAGAIPHPLSAITLIALYPLAAHMLLNETLRIKADAPADLCEESPLVKAGDEIRRRLEMLQPSFDHQVELRAEPTGHHRACRVMLTIDCGLAIEEIERIYDSIYDDHNFTFIISQPADTREVSGTHKCVISIRKPSPGRLEIDALADCRMRGGAGEAVHVMNLLFGLHEKVGLTLKAAKY